MKDKILVIQTAFIGDAVLTLPMIQRLKALFPESDIDVIAIPSTADIFLSSPFVNDVLTIDKKGKDKSILRLLSFSKKIRNRRYNRVYSPHRSIRSSVIVFFSGGKFKIGFNNSSFKYVYNSRIEYRKDFHEVRRNLYLIGADTSAENWKIKPELKITRDQKSKISSFLDSIDGNYFAALAPGSIWATKVYPYEGFIEIAKHLAKNLYKVVLIGGEQDLQLCKKIAAADLENVIITAGKFSLTESVELISRSRILISNDSAPSHLGICTDTPVLTIYCSTVASFGFYPYLGNSSYISYDELDCKPCGIHGHNVCPIKTFDCGKLLTHDIIINEIDSILKK